jgi:putative addiction module killer protein
MQIEIYQNTTGQQPFSRWLKDLKDRKAKLKIQQRLAQVRAGNLGDCKSAGGGILELRVHFGPGYRIYCAREGQKLIILLCAGDKSTQQKDIALARSYWEDFKTNG